MVVSQVQVPNTATSVSTCRATKSDNVMMIVMIGIILCNASVYMCGMCVCIYACVCVHIMCVVSNTHSHTQTKVSSVYARVRAGYDCVYAGHYGWVCW